MTSFVRICFSLLDAHPADYDAISYSQKKFLDGFLTLVWARAQPLWAEPKKVFKEVTTVQNFHCALLSAADGRRVKSDDFVLLWSCAMILMFPFLYAHWYLLPKLDPIHPWSNAQIIISNDFRPKDDCVPGKRTENGIFGRRWLSGSIFRRASVANRWGNSAIWQNTWGKKFKARRNPISSH